MAGSYQPLTDKVAPVVVATLAEEVAVLPEDLVAAEEAVPVAAALAAADVVVPEVAVPAVVLAAAADVVVPEVAAIQLWPN